MTRYEGIELALTEGDIVTSKKGILMNVNLTGKKEFYYVYRFRYLGNGNVEALERSPAGNFEVSKP